MFESRDTYCDRRATALNEMTSITDLDDPNHVGFFPARHRTEDASAHIFVLAMRRSSAEGIW